METYALYLRKSRADLELESKGEMETLARHEKTLLELAKRQHLTITKIFREIVSGETIQARPVVQQMLDEIEQGQWSGILVMEIERLARGDTIDQGIVARAFKIGNAKIITPMKTFDPENEFDEEYFEFGLFMSRREYKTINRRIQRGRIASVKEGKFISSTPPYGYDRIKIENDKGYTLKPNAEADVVKLIYDMYINGNGMTVIASKLDNMKIIPRYRDCWSKSTISDILKNPVYIGIIRWAYRPEKTQSCNGELKKRRVNNTEGCIYVQGIHPAIINEGTFQKAQEIRFGNAKKTIKKDFSLQNPLAGLIFCKKCHSVVTRLAKNDHMKYDALKCSNRYCDSVSAPLFLVEQKIIDSLTHWLKRYNIAIKKDVNIREMESTGKLKQSVLKDLSVQLEKNELQMTNAFNLVEQGVYTSEIFIQRSKALTQTKAEILSSIAEIKLEIEKEFNRTNISISFAPTVESVLKAYYELDTAEEKNNLLKSIIQKVEYSKDTPNRRGQLLNDNFEIMIYPKLRDE